MQSFVDVSRKVVLLKKKKIENITTTTNNTLARLPSAELIDEEQTAGGQSVKGANPVSMINILCYMSLILYN